MNQEQKALILKEIQTWRDSKLLPAEYCDFLMNLYSEGDSVPDEHREKKGGYSTRLAGTSKIQAILLIALFLLVFLIFAFNFTWFPMPMQIGILFLGTIVFYFLAWRTGRNNALFRIVWLAVAALFAAGDGYFYLSRTEQLGDRGAVVAIMTLVFLCWLISGGLGRTRLIASLGLAGMLLMFATFLEKVIQVTDQGYGVLHLYWLFPAVLSLLLAYWLGRARVYIAPVFLFLGLAALFGPDVRLIVYHAEINFFIQAIVFLKLAVLLSLLIVFRLNLKIWLGRLTQDRNRRRE